VAADRHRDARRQADRERFHATPVPERAVAKRGVPALLEAALDEEDGEVPRSRNR
jgi:hypothetical protein